LFPVPLRLAVFALLAPLSVAVAQPAPPVAAAPQKIDASAAIEKKDPSGKFQRMHQSFLARGKSGPIGVLFLGDSITEGWIRAPHIWEHFYGKLDPANFGIGGDQTQHVIWRIENGELDGLHPKVLILMLGTNNTAAHTAAEIAAADEKIVRMIHAKLPETKVLLLAIFPRGARKDRQGNITPAAITDADKRMAVIQGANELLAKLDNGNDVRFLDIGARFLGQDGKIPFSLMPDQLHPNAAGYELWAEAMQPLLTEMLQANVTKSASETK
jgi:lysophospholipase L1-like esterase